MSDAMYGVSLGLAFDAGVLVGLFFHLLSNWLPGRGQKDGKKHYIKFPEAK